MKRHGLAVLCLFVLLLFPLIGEAQSFVPAYPDHAGRIGVLQEAGGCPSAAAAGAVRLGPEQAWSLERVDAPKTFGQAGTRSLVLDAAGNPHISYGEDRLYYAWYDGATWHRETVDATLGVGEYSSLALDAAGRPHISYYDGDRQDLKYATYDGAAWRVQTLDANVGSS